MNTKRRNEFPKMRGIEAFLDASAETAAADQDSTQVVALEQLSLPTWQPRRYFDPEKLNRLTDSIREHGVLEPLLVRPKSAGQYELVAGERRYRAAKQAGLTEVPIVIRELTDQDALQLALIENLQREDLNPVEETEGILELLSVSQQLPRGEVIALLNRNANAKRRNQELTDNVVRQLEEIEKLFSVVGRTTIESFRVHRLPLLNLPDDILTALRTGQIAYTKARAIARWQDSQQRTELLQDAIAQNWSLRQIKDRMRELEQASKEDTSAQSLRQEFKQVYQQLQRSQCWQDDEKRDQLQELMAQMRSLLEN